MSEISKYKCDICSVEAETDDFNIPEGWFHLSHRTKDEAAYYRKGRDICPACMRSPLPGLNEKKEKHGGE